MEGHALASDFCVDCEQSLCKNWRAFRRKGGGLQAILFLLCCVSCIDCFFLYVLKAYISSRASITYILEFIIISSIAVNLIL